MQDFAEPAGARDASFALDLSREGMTLHRRADGGWQPLATVALRLGTMGAGFQKLRDAAGVGRGAVLPVEVWLPAEHVLLRTVDTAGAVTPHHFSDSAAGEVVVDAAARTAESPFVLAAIPRTVLDETRDFLAPHRLKPSVFTLSAAPEGLDHTPVFTTREQPSRSIAVPRRFAIAIAAGVAAVLLGAGLYSLPRTAEPVAQDLAEIAPSKAGPDSQAPIAETRLAALRGSTAGFLPELPAAQPAHAPPLPGRLEAASAVTDGPALFHASLLTRITSLAAPEPAASTTAPVSGTAAGPRPLRTPAILRAPDRAKAPDLMPLLILASAERPQTTPVAARAADPSASGGNAPALPGPLAALDRAAASTLPIPGTWLSTMSGKNLPAIGAAGQPLQLAATTVFPDTPEVIPPRRPGVTVIPEAPEVIPPERAAEQPAEPQAAPGTGTDGATDVGVVVVPALPWVIPPPRPATAAPDEAPPPPEDPIVALIEAAGEQDLSPSANAISRQAPPRPRPDAMEAAARERQIMLVALAPSELALSRSDAPRRRPSGLSAPAAPATVVPAAVQPSATPEPAKPAPALPTAASVARAATSENAMPMRQLVLIGVYGRSGGRHALVRTAGGNYVKVKPGDNIEGYQVAAISADAIRLRRGGRDTLLVIPE